MINHINVPDAMGQIYCCLRNRVIRYDQNHQSQYCSACKMFNGTADGDGVECLWDDSRAKAGDHIWVSDPVREWAGNQKKRVQAFLAVWNSAEDGADFRAYRNSGEEAV